jgi:membrane associated rhomboid family serine protease
MIPLQDVIPTTRPPVATLALIGVNLLVVIGETAWQRAGLLTAPFAHSGLTLLIIGVWFLWLFGDNVEARLGRLTLVALYLLAGWVTGIGASGAITAVLAGYFLLLPRSRVLVLVPIPELLVEVPAAFFLGVWVVLHFPLFIAQPTAIWSFAIAFAMGAAVARLIRPPVAW